MFFQSTLGKDTLPILDMMWADLQHEELRRALLKSTISGRRKKGMRSEKEEEDLALSSKGLSQRKGEKKKKKKGMSKVKFFRCGQFDH